jgi:transcriptional regulator with XRE-family HTH domain
MALGKYESLGHLIGQRIRRAREHRGITQKELANLLGKTPQHISQIEVKGFAPRPELLKAIAQALNVTTDYLYGLTEVLDRTLTPAEVVQAELQKYLSDLDQRLQNAPAQV